MNGAGPGAAVACAAFAEHAHGPLVGGDGAAEPRARQRRRRDPPPAAGDEHETPRRQGRDHGPRPRVRAAAGDVRPPFPALRAQGPPRRCAPAAAVICVSETTARDVRELWAVPAERIVVAPHGPGQELPALPRAPAPEHFLYVGDREPRKDNRDAARGARALPDAGPGTAAAGARGAAGRPVEPERSAELYARAAAASPSLYEGFGLTLLEAMAADVRDRGAGPWAPSRCVARRRCGFDPGSVDELPPRRWRSSARRQWLSCPRRAPPREPAPPGRGPQRLARAAYSLAEAMKISRSLAHEGFPLPTVASRRPSSSSPRA